MSSRRNQKRTTISAILFLSFSTIFILQVPPFNVLDIDFAYAISSLLFISSGFVVLSYFHGCSMTSMSDFRMCVVRSTGYALLLLLVPLLLGVGSTMRQCSFTILNGIGIYLLTVVPTILLGASIATLISVVITRFHRSVYLVCFVLLLSSAVVSLVYSPQLTVYNLVLGYIPGFLYDEAVEVSTRFIAYRGLTVAIAFFLSAFAGWVWNKKRVLQKQVSSKENRKSIPEIFTMALFGPFVLVMVFFSDRIGFSASETALRQKLGGNYSTEHFDIVYALGKIPRERVSYIAKLQEYYYDELCNTLNIQAPQRITTFLYASPEQRARLIGAENTDFSKPWLRQIHLLEKTSERTLKHELVHVLAAEFGWSFLKLGGSIGILEGLAVALGDATWYDEPLDRAAAIILAVDSSYSPRVLFKSYIYSSNVTSLHYPIAGSFVKFLIDQYGMEAFKEYYHTNDCNRVYHQTLDSLIALWKQTLSQYQLTVYDSAKGRYYVSQRARSQNGCVRALARIRSEVVKYLEQREYDIARERVEYALALAPTPSMMLLKARTLTGQRSFEELVEFANNAIMQFDDAVLPIHLRLGDAYWALDSLAQARREYEYLDGINLSNAYDEAIAFRLEALEQRQEVHEWYILFTYDLDDTTRMKRLSRLSSPLAQYLNGKIYLSRREFQQVYRSFERAEGLRSPVLKFYRYFLWARALELDGRFDDAVEMYARAHTFAPTNAFAIETKEAMQRCTQWRVSTTMKGIEQ